MQTKQTKPTEYISNPFLNAISYPSGIYIGDGFSIAYLEEAASIIKNELEVKGAQLGRNSYIPVRFIARGSSGAIISSAVLTILRIRWGIESHIIYVPKQNEDRHENYMSVKRRFSNVVHDVLTVVIDDHMDTGDTINHILKFINTRHDEIAHVDLLILGAAVNAITIQSIMINTNVVIRRVYGQDIMNLDLVLNYISDLRKETVQPQEQQQELEEEQTNSPFITF